MNFVELKANIRTTSGNGPARALRRSGRIPGVLYGPDTESVLLSVVINDLEQVLKKSKVGQVLLNLVIQNGEASTRSAMIKELQTHPVSRNFLHVDFYEIALDRKIRVKIPVSIIGKAKGVEDGGMLQIIRRELEVLCLPFNIPELIEIDITNLDIGDSIHVGDVSLAEGIEFLDDDHFTVVTMLSPKIEAVAAEELELEKTEERVAKDDVSAAPEDGEEE